MKNKELPAEPGVEMIGRRSDVVHVADCVIEANCCSIVGVSNIGKSTVLRALAQPAMWKKRPGPMADGYLLVYVDLNLALQTTEQGFYEVILRNLLAVLRDRPVSDKLSSAIKEAYQMVITSQSPFMVSLAFENSLEAICSLQEGMLVLLLDEFDEIFAAIEPHVFVRMRALKDKHWARLSYVTATDHPLAEIRRERQTGEFCELFEGHTRYLTPLNEVDTRALVEKWATQSRVELSPEDVDFVVERAGGHPALLQATCRVLAKSREEAILRPTAVGYAHVLERLDSDPNVRLECAKLWSDLNAMDQETLITLLSGQEVSSALDSLIEKGIVRASAARVQLFGTQFADFVRRQRLVRCGGPRGVRIDVEAGDVWVDGKLAPVLTELEYKLLLLLYGNLDRICDKYKIVESVWGENYIDEVDDARIEKLMSRLREKIEPAPDDPRYLVTVRGRGYKLVSPE